MKKLFLTISLVFGLVIILFKVVTLMPWALGIKETAGISVLSSPTGADVYIDGQSVGKTPYQSDSLENKKVTVKIVSNQGSWEGNVILSAHTITYISRDLAKDAISGSGEILSLTAGSGVTVVSSPGGAEVTVDGNSQGLTPGSFNVTNGEHTFVIGKDGFINRSIKATVPVNFNLNLSVDLAATDTEVVPVTQNPSSTPTSTEPLVKVLVTPTGFLRVREVASTAGKELARVYPGDTLIFLSASGSWTKVRLSSGVEGFASSQYVSKQ